MVEGCGVGVEDTEPCPEEQRLEEKSILGVWGLMIRKEGLWCRSQVLELRTGA